MLQTAINIREWLAVDRDRPARERIDRDGALAVDLRSTGDLKRVLAWWNKVERGPVPGPGSRIAGLRAWANLGLLLGGLLLGTGIAGVALAYDGDYPVNVVALLGVLVGIPGLMLVVTLVLLPVRSAPAGTFRALLGGINAGRWVGVWLDRWLKAPTFVGYGDFARWQLLTFSQLLAIGYFVGVLGALVLRLTFTDLAFGWSTTLQVDALQVHRWFNWVAAPWSVWLPGAVPSADLVESSRFFRLAGARDSVSAAALGEWWPFVVLTVIVYGALPRLLLLVFGSVCLHRATTVLLLDDAEVIRLLDRLSLPQAAYAAEPEPAVSMRIHSTVPPRRQATSAVGRWRNEGALVVWNDALDIAAATQWLEARFGAAPLSGVNLGVRTPAADLHAAIAKIGEQNNARQMWVFSKGWEPPVLAFNDFLVQLREAVGGSVLIEIVPIDLSGTCIEPDARAVWSTVVGRLNDPLIQVATLE